MNNKLETNPSPPPPNENKALVAEGRFEGCCADMRAWSTLPSGREEPGRFEVLSICIFSHAFA